MDEKYEFIRGEHPNETVAYLLAEEHLSETRVVDSITREIFSRKY